jgi:hypothetical protein
MSDESANSLRILTAFTISNFLIVKTVWASLRSDLKLILIREMEMLPAHGDGEFRRGV